MRSRAKINVIISLIGQFSIIVLGLIIPRIMITTYGSDINGLLNTISQVFSYMALLEAGIGQAARNALMKPLADNNQQDISHVASIANNYFHRFTIYYFIGVVALSATFPFLIKTDVNRHIVFLIIFLEGLSGVLTFSKIQTITTILAADGRSYVINIITVANKIISNIVKIVMAARGVNIIYLEVAYFFITVGKVMFYDRYFKKTYPWIDLKNASKNEKLKDRNSYVLTELAWTIFSSTDLIVLSTFVNTKEASVYTIYNMVFANLNLLLNAMYSSVSYILGQTFHKNKNEYVILHDTFSSFFLGSMTSLMCTAYVLILPFISLYTKGVSDVEYIQPGLPVLFCLVQILSWSRYVTGNLTGLSGFAKETSYISLLEACLNVVLSIVLVYKYGIVGVLFATVISLPIKVVWCMYISDKKVLNRSYKRTMSILAVNYALFLMVVLVFTHFKLDIQSYGSFLLYGVILSLLFIALSFGLNSVANKEYLHIVNKYILKKH